MLADLEHRGPDGAGLARAAGAAIGMRHLRIRSRPGLELPFASARLGAVLAFNGETYRMAREGNWRFPEGGLDEAEAVASAFPGGRLDGMFALAAMGTADASVTLIRDPFGIKPLFLARGPSGVAFASEVRPLLRTLERRVVRPEAVAQFLVSGRVIDGGSFVDGIEPVPPGTRIVLRHGRIVERGRHTPAHPAAAPAGADDLREALRDSLALTLDAQRPVGLALSGGLDSSALAWELDRMGRRDLRTLSVLVDGAKDGLPELARLGMDDGPWLGWQHAVTVVDAAAYGRLLEPAVIAFGEPTSMSSVPLYLALARLAVQQGIVVLLLGEGPDELLMGYRSYLALAGGDRPALAFYLAPERRRLASRLLGAGVVDGVASRLATALGRCGPGPESERVRRYELEHSLEPLLRRADHLLMSHAVEGRTPFLHGGLPELAAGLPAERLLAGGQTKVPLRAAYRHRLPDGRATAPKRAFRAPVQSWLAGPLHPMLRRSLTESSESLAACGVDPAGCQHVLDELRRGSAEAASLAFCLLTLAIWLRWLGRV